MNIEDVAKVFGDGCLTIAIGQTPGSIRVYSGQNIVGYIRRMDINYDSDKSPSIEIEFATGIDDATKNAIESARRSLAELRWIKIR